ncbi:MAG: NAD(P)H-dependent oxidoreductase [Armatimonadia bacterium]
MASIYICFADATGEVELMARAIGDGVKEYGGEPILAYVPPLEHKLGEVLEDPLRRMLDERCRKEYALADSTELLKCDGAAFGTPAIYASASAEMKDFIDSLFRVRRNGELFNKPAATFTATHVGESGQELTKFTMWAPLSLLGFIMIGIPQAAPNLATTYEQSFVLGPDHRSHPKAPRLLTKSEWTHCHVIGARLAITAERMSEVAGDDALMTAHAKAAVARGGPSL